MNGVQVEIRRANDRGASEYGWLSSRHTFSFAGYNDPGFRGFQALKVLNDDWVAPGHGFGTHPHRDMEILSYVVSGALEHRDSLGTGSMIRPGEIQRMSAGTGIQHSEFNASRTDPVHFLQIWITPERTGLTPSYEQSEIPTEQTEGRFVLIASPDGASFGVRIHQDVKLYVGRFTGEQCATFVRPKHRHLWIHVVRGAIEVNKLPLSAGDAVYSSTENVVRLSHGREAEVLLFDLA